MWCESQILLIKAFLALDILYNLYKNINHINIGNTDGLDHKTMTLTLHGY